MQLPSFVYRSLPSFVYHSAVENVDCPSWRSHDRDIGHQLFGKGLWWLHSWSHKCCCFSAPHREKSTTGIHTHMYLTSLAKEGRKEGGKEGRKRKERGGWELSSLLSLTQLHRRPLAASEFIPFLSKIDPIYKEEEEAFKVHQAHALNGYMVSHSASHVQLTQPWPGDKNAVTLHTFC